MTTTIPQPISPDLSEIQKYWSAIRLPGEIVELRYRSSYVDRETGETKGRFCGERCNSPEELTAAIGKHPNAIYWVNIQKMRRDTPYDFYGTLGNSDMECFRWLVAETDPERLDAERNKLGGVTATDAEKAQSAEVSSKTYELFKSYGVDPAWIDSGNGNYVCAPIDLPNTRENCRLIARATYGLKAKFSTATVKIDSTSANIGRVLGLPGTMNSKGPNTPERPHRMRKLLLPGSRSVLLTVAQLEEMASWAPVKTRTEKMQHDEDDTDEGPFTFANVEEMFEKLQERTAKDEKSFDFESDNTISAGDGWNVRCPHDAEHTETDEALNRSTSVWMTDSGFARIRCLHDGDDKCPCGMMGWREFIAGWHAEDLQREIAAAPPVYRWPPEEVRLRRAQTGERTSGILFHSEEAYDKFAGRVSRTPAWEFASVFTDYPYEARMEFSWPNYEEWKKAVADVKNIAEPKSEFKFPAVLGGKVGDFMLLPFLGRFDGWGGRGRITIVAGASYSGKTTLIIPMLIDQWRGETIFGHVSARLQPLVIWADRGKLSNEETLLRMNLTPDSLPIEYISLCMDDLAVDNIKKAIEKQSPLPQVVFVEGADALLSQPSDSACVARFIGSIQRIAEYYHMAFILSIGSPKMKAKDNYVSITDTGFGSEKWTRMTDCFMKVTSPGDGSSDRRTLYVKPRNHRAVEFELEFNGDGSRLVQRQEVVDPAPETKIKTPKEKLLEMEDWALRREWFTRKDAAELGSKSAINRTVIKLIKEKKLETRLIGKTEELRFRRPEPTAQETKKPCVSETAHGSEAAIQMTEIQETTAI